MKGGNVWIANADGSGARQFTFNNYGWRSPSEADSRSKAQSSSSRARIQVASGKVGRSVEASKVIRENYESCSPVGVPAEIHLVLPKIRE